MATKDITDMIICIAVRNYKITQEYPIDYLMRTTGECFKVCLRAMERADRRGLIDYGVSIALPWLTKKGMELICNERR